MRAIRSLQTGHGEDKNDVLRNVGRVYTLCVGLEVAVERTDDTGEGGFGRCDGESTGVLHAEADYAAKWTLGQTILVVALSLILPTLLVAA